MTINVATNGSSSTSAMDYTKLKTSGSSVSSSLSSSSELSEEEKKYDVDGDSTLSATEKAAYLEAKAKEKELQSVKESADTEDVDSVSISDEALKLQKEGRPEMPSQQEPPENAQQRLMTQAIAEYNKFS